MDEQIFPYLLSSSNHNFSYKGSSFKWHGAKFPSGCSRIVVRKQCGVMNSYTIETSFAGRDIGPEAGLHFNARDWLQLGEDFGTTIDQLLHPSTHDTARSVLEKMTPPRNVVDVEEGSSSTVTKKKKKKTKKMKSRPKTANK